MNSHNILLVTEAQVFDAKTKKLKRTYVQNPDNDEALLTIVHEDANGNVKKKTVLPSKSFVSNFARVLNYNFMAITNFAGASAINRIIEALTGGATTLTANANKYEVTEAALTAAAQTAYGIWIGDSTNQSRLGLTIESGVSGSVEAFGDYMLKGLILAAGGSPETLVTYGATNVVLSKNTITISRRFTNGNASSIFINEVGVVGKVSASEYALMARDIVKDLSGGPGSRDRGMTVGAGDVVKIEYSYSISDASGFTSNYLKLIESLLTATTASSNPVDVNGNSYAVNFASARTQADLVAAATAVVNGIVIGGAIDSLYPLNEPSPLSVNKYKLDCIQLLEADLAHSAMTAIPLTQVPSSIVGGVFVPGYTQFGVYRDFENQLTERVHVQETALYMKEAAASHYYMITRGIFTPEILVEPAEILRINKYFRFLLADDPSVSHIV